MPKHASKTALERRLVGVLQSRGYQHRVGCLEAKKSAVTRNCGMKASVKPGLYSVSIIDWRGTMWYVVVVVAALMNLHWSVAFGDVAESWG